MQLLSQPANTCMIPSASWFVHQAENRSIHAAAKVVASYRTVHLHQLYSKAFPALAIASAALAGPVAGLAGPLWLPMLRGCALVTGAATVAFVLPTSWGVPFGLVERVAAYSLPLLLGLLAAQPALRRRRPSAS